MAINNVKVLNDGIYFYVDYPITEAPRNMPKETKTYLYSDSTFIRLATYVNGIVNSDMFLMPDIIKVEQIGDRVIKVTFADKTEEKAVAAKGDTFSLEQGVSTCITKKLLSMVSNGNGSSVYNKLIDRAIRIYTDNMETIRKTNEEAETARKREEKRISKAKKKREKRELLLREREIEIQKEAYLRAMIEFNKNSSQNQ